MLKPLVFVVSAQNHPELVARVVLLFHRLAIPVRALTMNPIDAGRSRLSVEVLAEPDASECITANLAEIVHLLSVARNVRYNDTRPRRRQRRPNR